MIITIKPVNISITSKSFHRVYVCVFRTRKIHSPNKFQGYNTKWLTIVTVQYMAISAPVKGTLGKSNVFIRKLPCNEIWQRLVSVGLMKIKIGFLESIMRWNMQITMETEPCFYCIIGLLIILKR